MSNALKQYDLNDYQLLMRRFSEASPYNAVHFIQLAVDYDKSSILTKINHELHELGLGRPIFSKEGHRVTFDPHLALTTLPFIKTPLSSHADKEINLSFSETAIPLRFFLIEDDKKYYLSVTYNHWLADGSSIYQLLRQIVSPNTDDAPSPLSIGPPNNQHCFRALKYFKTLSKFNLMRRNIIQFSQAYRPPLQLNNKSVRTFLHFYIFDETILPKLKQISKQSHVSINDIFIALLSRMMGRLSLQARQKVKRKPFKPKRNRILISVISDIRLFSRQNLRHCIHLLLGGYSLAFSAPEEKTFQALLRDTGKKSKQMKKKQIAVKSTLTFRFLLKQWIKQSNKFKLFHQKMPITVGISNMNLGTSADSTIQNSRYFRFSPASAMCPLVFSFTHFNHTLSLSIAATSNRYDKDMLPYLNKQFIHELDLLFEAVSESLPV